MDTAIKIIGMLGFLILCIGAASLAAALAFRCCEKAFEKLIISIRESERGRIANTMFGDSWWFSEDKRTMLLFVSYAKNRVLRQQSIEQTRAEWREGANK